jgi:hypothetical protein
VGADGEPGEDVGLLLETGNGGTTGPALAYLLYLVEQLLTNDELMLARVQLCGL